MYIFLDEAILRRGWWALNASFLATLLGFCGCTSNQLSISSEAQNSSLADLQYRMVLDNLAMFKVASNSLPWHMTISSGSVTINDAATAAGGFSSMRAMSPAKPLLSPSVGGNASRAVQDQWNVTPVVDTNVLVTLEAIYNEEASKDWFTTSRILPRPGVLRGRYGATYVCVKPGRMGD